MKKVLIIGATSAIGSELVQLLDQGCQLYLTGRDQSKLEHLSGNKQVFETIQVDLGKASLEDEIASLPELDAVVYAAGVTDHTPVKFIQEKHLEKVFNANFFGAVSITAALLKNKKIKKESSLVYLSSVAPQYPYFGGSLYIASKMALEGFVKTLAVELSSQKVRVNAISPVFVHSKMAESVNQFSSEDALNEFSKKHPFGVIEAKEVVDAIKYLMSPGAAAITGQVITLGNFNAGINQ